MQVHQSRCGNQRARLDTEIPPVRNIAADAVEYEVVVTAIPP